MDPFLRDLWRRVAGIPPVMGDGDMPSLADLRRTEWSEEFERLMRNRLVMGAFRYGPLRSEGKPQYDRLASARKRLSIYERTGNLEHLVDVANLMLCEFEEGDHPRRHLRAVDDGHHAEAKP